MIKNGAEFLIGPTGRLCRCHAVGRGQFQLRGLPKMNGMVSAADRRGSEEGLAATGTDGESTA